MQIIAKITDREILSTDGLSAAAPRYTARAALKNANGLYAVIYAEKLGFYCLPGGGVENGEDSVSALKRKILDETAELTRQTSRYSSKRVTLRRLKNTLNRIDKKLRKRFPASGVFLYQIIS